MQLARITSKQEPLPYLKAQIRASGKRGTKARKSSHRITKEKPTQYGSSENSSLYVFFLGKHRAFQVGRMKRRKKKLIKKQIKTGTRDYKSLLLKSSKFI